MANTGYQINPQLKKVTDDVNEYPLDVNNHLCSLTGLPQDTKPNDPSSSDYRILNPTSCPVVITYTYVKKADFQKNDCTGQDTGSILTYSKTYTSTISVGDAVAQADADVTNYNNEGQAYANTNGICNPPLPSDAVGVIVVDLFVASTMDVCGFVDSPEFASDGIYQIPVYRGNNFLPNGTAPANCWSLAGDYSGSLYRFQFNVARMLNTKGTTVPYYDFKIRGRGTSSGTLSGAYSLKGADHGNMIMGGSPGSYQPSVQNANTIGIQSFSGKAYVGGANGAIGIAFGNDILHFRYTVATKQLQLL